MNKCLLCFSENVYETHDDDHPFACYDCNAWGFAMNDISEPDFTDDEYRHGQVARRPAAA